MSETTFKVGDLVGHGSHGDGEITYGPVLGAYGGERVIVKFSDGERAVNPNTIYRWPAFAIGDTVKLSYDKRLVKLVAGPFKNQYDDVIWVGEWPDGTHVFPHEGDSMEKVKTPDSRPIEVGDRVRVVVDDPDIQAGEFVGLVGVVDDKSGSVYKVRFGDGTGRHGDKANGHWWVEKVERVADEGAETETYDGIVYDLSARYRDTDGDYWTFRRINGTVRGNYRGIDVEAIVSAHNETLAHAVREYGPLTRV